MKMRYEIIESYNGMKYLYLDECKSIFPYSEALEICLKQRNGLWNDEENSSNTLIAKDILEKYKSEINKYILDYKEYVNEIYNRMSEQNMKVKRFSTLWINVSNDCNLRCIYCYGNGGSFNKERKILKREKLIQILDFWLERIDNNSKKLQIIFFGGEPLMNKSAVIFTINYIKEKIGNQIPVKFGITTNGTIIDNDLLQKFSENEFNITLSIDGGQQVQDINRPFLGGKGSYEIIKHNIEKMLKKNISLIARVTVTHNNVRSLKQCFEDIWALGIESISFEIVSTNNKKLRLTEEDIEFLISELDVLAKMQYEYFINGQRKYIVNLIKYGKVLHSKKLNVCSFGAPDILKVDTDGNIFKCHRMIGNDEFLVGNIENNIQGNCVHHKYINIDSCESCKYKALCIPCYDVNYTETGKLNIAPESHCKYIKNLIKENLKLYISINEYSNQLVRKIYK